MNSGYAEMVSFGGGLNSVAMTIMLVESGWRGPIVFADTGTEMPDTYCYLDYFEREYLKPRELELIRLKPGSEYHGADAQVDLYSYCMRLGIVPFPAVRWCSIKWKRKPLENWRQKHNVATTLIGIDAGEPGRVRDSDTVRYPLVEAGIDRTNCRRIIESAGLAIPPKSHCFFCPNQTLSEWRQLFFEHPDLYRKAAFLEENASGRRGRRVTLSPRDISLTELSQNWNGQMRFDWPDMTPCICKL